MNNERFSISRDKYQWILTEHTKGIGKKGQDIVTSSDSYYPKLEQVMRASIDKGFYTDEEYTALEILKVLKRIDDRLAQICKNLIGE